ncbi:MAG: filamentous hemagglutinin N-terminal domain-containing protein [Cyanobacteria bacterium J06621_8]
MMMFTINCSQRFKFTKYILNNKILLFCVCICTFFSIKVNAQVIPDSTLGNESSTVRSVDSLQNIIEGGAIRDDNLFHSFQDFNIGEGFKSNFANPDGVTNIFSRITGGNASQIFGTLEVNGVANLFLMNPNGIVFGEKTAINVNGAFLGTTAENIFFSGGDIFSAVETNKTTLTVDVPIGLGFGSNPGTIVIKGSGHTLEDTINFTPVAGRNSSQGVQIKPKQSFALFGGDIILEGGIINANEGHVLLGSIKEGEISFDFDSSQFFVNYEKAEKLGNIKLTNRSLVDASGFNSGSVEIYGSNITLENTSVILNQNSGVISSDDVKLTATESISFSDPFLTEGIRSGVISETLNSGSGGDIFLSAPEVSIKGGTIANSSYGDASGGSIYVFAKNLSVSDTGSIGTATSSISRGGNIVIDASDSVNVGSNSNMDGAVDIILSVTTGFENSGDVVVRTSKLSVENGGIVGSVSRPSPDNLGGQTGRAGDVLIDATESVKVAGSSVFSPSNIISSSISFGDSGNLTINTSNLLLQDDGALSVSAAGDRNAGRLHVTASKSIIIDAGSISASSRIFNTDDQAVFQLPLDTTGLSGNLILQTSSLNIINGGSITVRNFGTNNAGNLMISSDAIYLRNGSTLTASTASGEGGNIIINSENIELIEHSQITASAGGEGNGGNIDINTKTILGLGNSDITANAIGGNGGNISIRSNLILGLDTRSEITDFSDITASSSLGIDGTIQITAIENNLQSKLEQSELELIDNNQIISNSCLSRSRKQTNLTISNHNRHYGNSNRSYSDVNFSLTGLNSLPTELEQSTLPQASNSQNDPSAIPAEELIKTKDGRVFLVAAPQDSKSYYCQGDKN